MEDKGLVPQPATRWRSRCFGLTMIIHNLWFRCCCTQRQWPLRLMLTVLCTYTMYTFLQIPLHFAQYLSAQYLSVLPALTNCCLTKPVTPVALAWSLYINNTNFQKPFVFLPFLTDQVENSRLITASCISSKQLSAVLENDTDENDLFHITVMGSIVSARYWLAVKCLILMGFKITEVMEQSWLSHWFSLDCIDGCRAVNVRTHKRQLDELNGTNLHLPLEVRPLCAREEVCFRGCHSARCQRVSPSDPVPPECTGLALSSCPL